MELGFELYFLMNILNEISETYEDDYEELVPLTSKNLQGLESAMSMILNFLYNVFCFGFCRNFYTKSSSTRQTLIG